MIHLFDDDSEINTQPLLIKTTLLHTALIQNTEAILSA
jgi:hypothetical protein